MRPMKNFLPVLLLLIFQVAAAQDQVCPLNSNWSFGNLTHWEAYTGNNSTGNPAQIVLYYDSSQGSPSGTIGVSNIQEYQLPSVNGIQVITSNSTDPYGNFQTIPKINGYNYVQTIKLGSTSITRNSDGSSGGGYVRGVSYQINVPPGPTTEPYTMTYAYAMVLENGTHNSNEQPLFKATLKSADSIISCASPQYFLPTYGSQRNIGAVLDTAAAKASGFFPSRLPSPNPNPNGGANATHLFDVWCKSWTEVTFDLSPYRGQQVTLTFETDNCVPGGHFAYSYIALRNTCGGLLISGDTVACQGITLTYSVPSLAGATYQWQVPGDWSILAGSDSSVLQVKVGTDNGDVTAQEQNSCADLHAVLPVATALPTIAGALSGGSEVCIGTNAVTLTLGGGARGSVLSWLASTNNGVSYTSINDTTYQYTATNLTDTTVFRVLIQNGESCAIDTAAPAVVDVDPLSVGGSLSPASMQFCLQQTKDALFTLVGNIGKPVNWQSSPDEAAWTDFAPPDVDSEYEVPAGTTASTYYRVIVQSGVCPATLSNPAVENIVTTPFPQAAYNPADTLICYNTPAALNALISIGTSYTWTFSEPLANQGDGNISVLPYAIQATATPLTTTNYVLNVTNAGCPNELIDTFHVAVLAPVLVSVSGYPDTSIVIDQPLQLQAVSNDTTSPAGDTFSWTPSEGLNNPDIFDPVALFTEGMDSVRYFITATTQYGCKGTTSLLVKVFSTPPSIFVPNAFTPGGATNNLFRPIPVGISRLEYFRVYNRWGRLVYATSIIGEGWDGRLGGQNMEAGTYVWMVEGVSYTGKAVFAKGTMILVR
jgi:gliding motility-associated-like protein